MSTIESEIEIDNSVSFKHSSSIVPQELHNHASKASLRRMSSRGTSLSRHSGSRRSLDPFDEEKPKKKKLNREHPYEKLFGKRVTQHLADFKQPQPIAINWNEYRATKWPNVFPDFIGDLIQYLCGFDMIQFLQDRKSK